MQRASLSLLRSCLAGPLPLEASLQRALTCSLSTVTGAGSGSTASVRPSVLFGLTNAKSCAVSNVRFAGDYKPAVPGNTIENWSKLRDSFNKERPSSLGGNYYANVLVMGFAYWLNEAYYFPPRTIYIGALVFFCLYVRKAFFSTPLAFKTEY
ncbi:hypothetical protein GPECTOR_2g1243 [Gonium pectorale]|uniref:Uncharacterized protein n=1 Tax=Gonium pectorale TaxID=33097 RepID=A0A150H112_GONPE|nr:hypothetical protein GPECTOR_2g1243 [Gonium pectorale]|eukprot:KXZ55693.1 hypothetical protein GPECTOR_2g1243 [Gonium pectorale]